MRRDGARMAVARVLQCNDGGSMKTGRDTGIDGSESVLPQRGKTRITIYLDDDVLEMFRERAEKAGRGYQTLINEALRDYTFRTNKPVDEAALRRILREELRSNA